MLCTVGNEKGNRLITIAFMSLTENSLRTYNRTKWTLFFGYKIVLNYNFISAISPLTTSSPSVNLIISSTDTPGARSSK